MHRRFKSAAVAVQETSSPSRHVGPNRSTIDFTSSPLGRVLWATHSMSVGGGRVVGVRLVGQLVEVAFVGTCAERLQWVVAETVLTQFQIENWLRTSGFNS